MCDILRATCEEALDSSLERYFGGSAASSVPVRREEVHGAVPAADVPPATEVRPLVRPDQAGSGLAARSLLVGGGASGGGRGVWHPAGAYGLIPLSQARDFRLPSEMIEAGVSSEPGRP